MNKYNILVVSNSAKFVGSVQKILEPVSEDNFEFCSNLSLAIELCSREYDFIIVDHKENTDLLFKLKELSKVEVVAMLPSENKDMQPLLAKHGITSVLKPLTGDMLIQIYFMLCTTREKIKKLNINDNKYIDQIMDMTLLDQAKLLLIVNEKLSEDEGHRYIEKQAMEKRITKIESAKQVLNQYGM